ncbi:head morphogenesis protein (endogenous virus) [Clostridium phage phiCT9441A]|uniref:minor head protein n=1 Tax=Clostridium phage phiCT9441A TaxID=1567014 RepID=UPI000572A8FC|nr:minor capsid protein [Clostridium tetani]YP_009219405.1 minor head protein [Clostridium phage phiCT9441A]AJA42652.1 head morphogenesis protein [Clostridium phage phiCT9441A]SUY66138.1 prophage head protein [Clostridium tetani]
MKNKEYWKKRSEQVATKQYKKADNYILSMQLEYQEALYTIQKDIESFYSRFAANNEISLQEAKRLLNSNELREFKMGLKEFTNKAKNNIDDKWEQELNNVSYKVRISRLQSLQTQINNEIQLLYSKQQNDVTSLLNGIYEDTYYRNIYEVHKGLGIGVNFAKLDTNTIDKVIKEPWYGDNYSSRIWNNKEKLIMELQTNLTQAFIRGDSIDKTSKIIAERMNVAKNRARTLVNTESAYITSKATFDSYNKSGVIKQYEILATLDLRTSRTCRKMDGWVFKISEKEIGVNAPPFHPNCRTTTVAYFPDEIDEERIARDSEGNIYYVDGNMNYKNWYNKYVKGNPKEEIAEKKLQNRYNDKKLFDEYIQVLKNLVPKSFEKFQDLKYNDIDKWNELKSNFKIVNSYKVDYGNVSPQKILELHKLAFETKRNKFTGKYKKEGNIAVVQYDNTIKYAHSKIQKSTNKGYEKFKGDKNELILLKDKESRVFKTKVVDGYDRFLDTEAKIFEYLDSKAKGVKEITLLSEKDMCESCRGVAKQFIDKYKNVKVNLASGKKDVHWEDK